MSKRPLHKGIATPAKILKKEDEKNIKKEEDEEDEEDDEDGSEDSEDRSGNEDEEVGSERRKFDGLDDEEEPEDETEVHVTDDPRDLSNVWPDTVELVGCNQDFEIPEEALIVYSGYLAKDILKSIGNQKKDEQSEDGPGEAICIKVLASDESALKSSVRSDGESWRKITISSSHPGEGKPFVNISCYDYEPMRGSVFTERKKWLYLTEIEDFDDKTRSKIHRFINDNM